MQKQRYLHYLETYDNILAAPGRKGFFVCLFEDY